MNKNGRCPALLKSEVGTMDDHQVVGDHPEDNFPIDGERTPAL